MNRLQVDWSRAAGVARQQGAYLWALFRQYLKRCQQDSVTMTAGHLAYVTLLSLVPMVAVSFAMFSAYPGFEGVREQVQSFVYENFVPTASEVVSTYMDDFVGNASKTTSLGILALFVIAFMLMSAIDKALNRIWRVHEKRRLALTIPMYWMILTMGPMLAGASIGATSYFVGLDLMGDVSWIKTQLLKLLPFLLSTTVFLLLFILVPIKTVRFKHGLAGALLTAFLFEVAKRGFAIYIAKFASYQAIYGALAAVPIIFVWVYLSWVIVLLGAELTATLGEYEPERDPGPEKA